MKVLVVCAEPRKKASKNDVFSLESVWKRCGEEEIRVNVGVLLAFYENVREFLVSWMREEKGNLRILWCL
ncbi:hypothetical protein VNO77_22874 [Canavalia gladiata]|uniref:Uncharacterized protein n=1 Tax=Canavalia gladiata TaxID=3824 RepID=A0AAN9L3F3_CANGL